MVDERRQLRIAEEIPEGGHTARRSVDDGRAKASVRATCLKFRVAEVPWRVGTAVRADDGRRPPCPVFTVAAGARRDIQAGPVVGKLRSGIAAVTTDETDRRDQDSDQDERTRPEHVVTLRKVRSEWRWRRIGAETEEVKTGKIRVTGIVDRRNARIAHR